MSVSSVASERKRLELARVVGRAPKRVERAGHRAEEHQPRRARARVGAERRAQHAVEHRGRQLKARKTTAAP